MWTLLARTANCLLQHTLENTSSVDQPEETFCGVAVAGEIHRFVFNNDRHELCEIVTGALAADWVYCRMTGYDTLTPFHGVKYRTCDIDEATVVYEILKDV